MVDVTDGADVNMGLGSFKFLLLPFENPLLSNYISLCCNAEFPQYAYFTAIAGKSKTPNYQT